MTMKQWSTTAATNASAATGVNWAEGQAPSTVNDSARQLMADVRSWYESAEWIDYGYSISYVSATVFKFHDANRTALVAVDRRVKAGVGAGTIYGTVSDVTFSTSDTQVTVTWDSGTLDMSLSAVALGILASTNRSIWPASTTTPGVVQFAVQSDQETGTSNTLAVTPGRQHFHQSALKCWGSCGVAGNLGSPSYNITSVGDTGAGRATVTIATDFSTAVYAVHVTCEYASAGLLTPVTGLAAGSFEMDARNNSNVLTDPTTYKFSAAGDHA